MTYRGFALSLKGKRFGRLVVTGRAPARPRDKNAMWTCQCDCGGWAVVAASNLAASTRSCGCLAREAAARLLHVARYTQTHNLSQSLEYKSWCAMKQRCGNPNNPHYPNYGARGITVCERWHSFENFYADMGPKAKSGMSVERVNNDGNYCPENCIWATPKIQGKNTRMNKYITIDGQRLNMKDWCELFGVARTTPYEMTRIYKRKGAPPPRCQTTEEAIRLLYRNYMRGHAA